MEGDVDLDGKRAALVDPLERVDDRPEQTGVLAVSLRPARREPDAPDLEHESRLHHLGEGRGSIGSGRVDAGARAHHERSAADPRLHEPSRREGAHRLAHGGTADAEVGRERPLRWKPVAGLESPAQDEDEQLVRDELVRPPRERQGACRGLRYRRLTGHRADHGSRLVSRRKASPGGPRCSSALDVPGRAR